jgi:hypothetical protein
VHIDTRGSVYHLAHCYLEHASGERGAVLALGRDARGYDGPEQATRMLRAALDAAGTGGGSLGRALQVNPGLAALGISACLNIRYDGPLNTIAYELCFIFNVRRYNSAAALVPPPRSPACASSTPAAATACKLSL